MPTTANHSALNPATSDPQTPEGCSEDNSQAVEAHLDAFQSLTASVDTAQNTTPESDTSQQVALTNVGGSEVSSTVEDTDPSLEYENDIVSTVLPATSTSINLSQNSSTTPSENEPVVIPPPAPSKGFQDAFAAFASAALPEPEYEEEEEMDIQESIVADSNPRDASSSENLLNSYLKSTETDSSSAPNVTDGGETCVSSAIDSSFVSTTKDLLAVEQPQEGLSSGECVQQLIQNEQPIGEMEDQLYHVPAEQLTEPVCEELTQNQPEVDMEDQQQLTQQHTVAEDAVPDQVSLASEQLAQDASAVSDSVYFIQGTDANGEVITSIIDPNEIGSYFDSVVYKQCMMSNGEIETTIVHSGVQPSVQEQHQSQSHGEQQVIYAHDLNGQLTPIDSAQSANDIAPPGKQFVYMQDSTGRIIRTIMDANQTMVPGQQVYYTQSDDGRIITSVMDPSTAGAAVVDQQPQGEQAVYQSQQQQDLTADSAAITGAPQQAENVGETANFNIDSGLSGLNMLAELSHLTAEQTPTASGLPNDSKGTSSTDSNSADMDEFRPVAMVTRRVGADEGVDEVSSTISGLKIEKQKSPVYQLVSELKPELQVPALSVSRDNLFVQWQNLDAMCWMDVVLIMLVYSPTLRPLVNMDPGHELASTLLITLLKANRQAQVLVQNLLKKSNGVEICGLHTGTGNAATSIQDPKTAKLVSKENMDEIGKAINILYAMREKIWQALQPRLRCERGKHNSPVLVLPLLVREKPAIKQMFTMNYRYVFKCEKCGYTQDDIHTKILPSIPAVPEDFNMREPCFVRNCFECQAPNQRMMMKFEGLQDFVQMHFVKGLPHNRFDELSFDFQGDHFEVTAVVHYKNNPDHFIAWVRNAPGSTWMECDDLKSVITRYHHTMPAIPPGQVHMVMWERRLTPAHELQMRDTEDTRVLASLVLTVQQPSTHQTSDPAARPTGLPSTSPSGSWAGKTSSLLSSIPNQSPVFSPYILRGRGRGSRGRGSRGSRGAPSSLTSTIRRSTPTSLTSSPNANQTGSPQVVRLPLSALSNSSPGTTHSTTKYVLMGNSGAGQGTGGTASKVVVVRSQGGANNLTTQQLLQLLQRTGAISQSGAKIAIATSGVNTTAAITSTATTDTTSSLISNASKGSTSYIIQSDGTITTTSAPVSTVAPLVQSSMQLMTSTDTGSTGVPIDTINTPSANNSGESKPSVKLVSVLPSALASLTSTYGQVASTSSFRSQDLSTPLVNQVENATEMLDQNTTSSHATETDTLLGRDPTLTIQEAPKASIAPQVTESEEESFATANIQQTSESDPLLVSPETTEPPTITTGSNTTQQQGIASRFIQIPTSGGGSILTQLVVRNGKMVLVPVDKATQAQAEAQPSSVLKLSGGSVGSAPKITLRTTSRATSQNLSENSTNSKQEMDTATHSASSSVVGSLGLGSLMAKGNQGFITMPTQGSTPKRTIQLISVPRGPGQQNSKTIILNPGNASNTTAHQISLPSETVNSSAGDNQTVKSEGQGRILSQEGNLVIRELRRPEASPATLTTTLMGDSDSSLISTPAVSLLRDMSSRTSSVGGISLVGSGQKQPESFKYILPGSNTTHILHTGSSTSTGQVTSRAFTALSSSGTIIGGQLTPAIGSTAMGTSPMDQDLGLTEEGGNVFGLDTTEYIPASRGRPRGGRGSRGSRGSRGNQRGRGRIGKSGGRGRASSELWSSMEMVAPGSSQNISTLSGLRQIGAHVIESGAENVDGVPVLSIPEFSDASQSEASTAVESIQAEAQMATGAEGILGQSDQQPVEAWTSPEPSINTSTNPRVITQSIPSVKANHGFDILTQGILGSEANGSPQTFKKARSLLTGAQVTTGSSSFSGPHESVASVFSAPEAESVQTEGSALHGSSSTQSQHSEIDTLIEAALAAAKPSKVKSLEDNLEASDQTILDKEHDISSGPGKLDQRVMSVEERHVSTAEKYRMPVELFQPDDEPSEKSKSEIWSTKILETDEQPQHEMQTEEKLENWMESEETQTVHKEQQVDVENEQLCDVEMNNMKGMVQANDNLVPDSSPSIPATDTPAAPQKWSPSTSPGRISSEHRTSSAPRSLNQILSSKEEAVEEAMPLAWTTKSISSFSLQTQNLNSDTVESQLISAQDNNQSLTPAETEKHSVEKLQETISVAREEEGHLVQAKQQILFKKGKKRGRSRKSSCTKSSNTLTNVTSSLVIENKHVSLDEGKESLQDKSVTSDMEKNKGYYAEKDLSPSNISTEKFENDVEKDNGDASKIANHARNFILSPNRTQSSEQFPELRRDFAFHEDMDGNKATAAQTSQMKYGQSSISNANADVGGQSKIVKDDEIEESGAEASKEYMLKGDVQILHSYLDNSDLIKKSSNILMEQFAIYRDIKNETLDPKKGKDIQNNPKMQIVEEYMKQDQILCSRDSPYIEEEKSSPAVLVRPRRQCADWGKLLSGQEGDSYFNYNVLKGGSKLKRSRRHPSFNFSHAFPLHKEEKGCLTIKSLQTKVTRRHKKSLQLPKLDPSKDPTLVPMVVEGEEACTGGSVVTSPTGGEVFTSVVIGHKRLQADWACGMSDHEEDEEHSCRLDSSLSPEEIRIAQTQYCQQLAMVLFMEAGDLSSLLLGVDDGETDNDISDSSIRGSEADIKDEKTSCSNQYQQEQEVADESILPEGFNSPDVKSYYQSEGSKTSGGSDFNYLASHVKLGKKRGRKKKSGVRSPLSASLATSNYQLNTPSIKRQRLSQDDEDLGVIDSTESNKEIVQVSSKEDLEMSLPNAEGECGGNTNNLSCSASEGAHVTEAKRKRGRPKKKSNQEASPVCQKDSFDAQCKVLYISREREKNAEDVEIYKNIDESDIVNTGHTNGLSSPNTSEDNVINRMNSDAQPVSVAKSPSRRSGRMTIPSKRVLDSWDGLPLSQLNNP